MPTAQRCKPSPARNPRLPSRAVLAAGLALLLATLPVQADDLGEAATVVRGAVDSVLALLADKTLADDAKRARIMETITPVFDFPLMAKLTLGPRNWPRLTPDQQAEFTDLFVDQLEQSYAGNIGLFADESVVFNNPTRAGNKIHVATDIVSAGERTRMLYKLYAAGGAWKVYDVEINGVSIISSYRNQYAQVLDTDNAEALLAQMRKQVQGKPDAAQ